MPSPDLRERTLAAVRAEGVRRPLPVAAGAPAAAAAAALPASAVPTSQDAPATTPIPLAGRPRRATPLLGWAATVAAAVVLSVVATSLLIGAQVDGQRATQAELLAAQAESITALEEMTTETMKVTAQPDAEHVTLVGVEDPNLDGSLAYSPGTAELVVVANGLTPPPPGLEYRCWVEVAGTRQRVGKMFFSRDLAYWVGSAPAVSGLSSGATFGVSLVGASGSAIDTDPVLLGAL
jgi:hypothetical protein